MTTHEFWRTVKTQLTVKSFLLSFFIGGLYAQLSLYLLNIKLVKATILGNFSLSYKATLLFQLLGGLWTALSIVDLLLLIITSLLAGFNILLIIKTFRKIKQHGNLTLAVGTGSILGIISVGCTSCGFSVLSLLGLSTSLSFLPFSGSYFHLLAIFFLLFSILFTIRALNSKIACERIKILK